MRHLSAALVAVALSGCAAIEPNALHVGMQHLSSATQHFGKHPTNVGNDCAAVSALWYPTPHTYIELQECYIVDGAPFTGGHGHEMFNARAGLSINLK